MKFKNKENWLQTSSRFSLSLLYVPSINRTVKFYGKVGKYKDSQRKIEQELSVEIRNNAI